MNILKTLHSRLNIPVFPGFSAILTFLKGPQMRRSHQINAVTEFPLDR